jgi:hypothetical protein
VEVAAVHFRVLLHLTVDVVAVDHLTVVNTELAHRVAMVPHMD